MPPSKQQIESEIAEKFPGESAAFYDERGVNTVIVTVPYLKSFLFSSIEQVLKEVIPQKAILEKSDSEGESLGEEIGRVDGQNLARSEFIKKAELLGYKVD